MSLYAKLRLAVPLLALVLLCPPRDAFAACALIDDMENYSNWIPEGPHIFLFWEDGWGDCVDSGNNTGCTIDVTYEVVLDALQSMKYEYDNDGFVWSPCTLEYETTDHCYSVARAEVAELLSRITTDWNIAGRNLLSIPFHGTVGNAIEDMWIKLEDNAGGNDKAYYGDNPGEDPNNMAVESWHNWIIDLNSFTPEVDLNNVLAISIGIGEEGSTTEAGSGTLYFDDISLCSAETLTVYVNAAATGNNTGFTWHDAFTSLQDALYVPTADRIFVAEGTHYPTVRVNGQTDRYKTFQMRNSVRIYGGFPAAGDPNFQDRNPTRYPTILSGDIGTPGDANDNCYHVFYHVSTYLDSTAVLDGFTITAGNANGDSIFPRRGAGMYNHRSHPTLLNCIFTANTALYGAAIYNVSSNTILTNCTFAGNSTLYQAAIVNDDSDPNITNSIIWANPAPNDIQIYNAGSSTPIVTYTHVQGGWPGTGNTQGDPLFVRNPNDGGDGWGVGNNDDLGDLRLQPASPCIDAANNASLPPDTDFLGRILDGDCNRLATIDMGAHEFDFTALGDTAEDCDVDQNDFAILAAHWKETPCNEANNFCSLADIDRQSTVDFKDLLILAQNWLAAAK